MYISELSLWITAAHDRYNEAKKLVAESKRDPSSDPYRSKYKAKNIFAEILLEIETKWKNHENMQFKLISFLVQYEIGVICLDTEELAAGCDTLTEVWEKMIDESTKPEYAFIALNVLNHLAVLWCDRGELQKSLDLLKEAEKLYQDYKSKNDLAPYDADVIFTMETAERQDWKLFEKSLTHTYYYMAQVFEHLGENANSAKYCRETLKRQLDGEESETSDWAMNCATLSQYYIQEKSFVEARHLLACAAYVLFKYETKIERDLEANRDLWMAIHQNKASLSCCWAKFCFNLLANTDLSIESSNTGKNPDFARLIDDDAVVKMENKIPCPISTYSQAKDVFVFAQNHVSVAKSYFTLSEYANTYAQIVQDHSKLFKFLSTLEEDPSRQCKMFKRRVDMLEELLQKLNPQFYLGVCRQLQFEIGEICYEMGDLKTKMKCSSSSENAASRIQKVNALALKSILYFQNFLDSLKQKDGEFPNELDEDVVRPALVANFYIAKNYAKVVETDTNKKRENLLKMEQHYQFIVDYVEKNPQHACHMENELPLIKEMLQFMPERIKMLI